MIPAASNIKPAFKVYRGQKLATQLLFEDDTPIPAKYEDNGRDKQLVENRNILILHRFYYKAKILRTVYAITLKELSDEFFLSQVQLQKIITSKTETINDIRATKPTVADLKKKFPFMVW